MTRDLALDDPEVLADQRLRAASERDRARSSLVTCECGHHVRDHHATTGLCMASDDDGTRRCEGFARAGGPTWSPPVIVERVPCAKGCSTIVDVLDSALAAFEAVNASLRKRGERPVAKAHGFICDACKREGDELEQTRRRPHEQREIGFDNERPMAAGKGTR